MRIASLLITTLLIPAAWADCECGYTVNDTLWTELWETDFLHLKNINESGWIPQEYEVDALDARGPYGKSAQVQNVVTNPLKSPYDWAGDGINGGDSGTQLIVKGGDPGKGKAIPMAEMSTNRSDMLYGSFRAGIRLTDVSGTCGAFFWYFNDSQEIDMEFLSREFNSTSHPVNLVLQSEASVAAGFNAANSDSFLTHPLPFDPTDGFHEYRFDWSPDKVDFYADGVFLRSMGGAGVPSNAAHLTLSQWTNGDPKWSGGPPESDAIMQVSYVKAYFNSSETKRQDDWQNRCKDIGAAKATCDVPEVEGAPQGNVSGKTFFFSQQQNMTVNQTTAGGDPGNLSKSGAFSILSSMQGLSTIMLLFFVSQIMIWCL
ncbi:MAG: hypothetical protein LQ342_008102 [Letrouitia transgressa]|nr:MAG: hypothetical protein LQ342_008102 [Letrouitia transgressa]